MTSEEAAHYRKFIGQTVINVWTSAFDQNLKTGVLVEVKEGVNGLLGIRWNHANKYITWMPPRDIALKETYPNSRWGNELN